MEVSNMDELQLQERILTGEDLHTEFKEKISSKDKEDLAKSIVCFANTDGGQLIVGVTDQGEIVGIDEDEIDQTIRLIDDVAFNRCEPPVTVVVETFTIDDKKIIVINIPKGAQRPYRTAGGRFYIRSASKCRQASREELLRLFQATRSIFYDETEIFQASLKDLDMDYAQWFLRKYFKVEAKEEELPGYLINIKAITENHKPTLTGLLFFGEAPQTILPYLKITCAYIEGEDISVSPFDKKDMSGKVHHMLEESMRFLRLYVRETHKIKGLEPEVYPEIEDFVLREAIVNAVAHRDYTISAPVRVLVFTDRIEIHTPGNLPNTVTIESMKAGIHVPRNPIIYNFLSKMGLVTDLGSGIRRIIDSVRKTIGKEPDLRVVEGEFILSIPRIKRYITRKSRLA